MQQGLLQAHYNIDMLFLPQDKEAGKIWICRHSLYMLRCEPRQYRTDR